MVQLQPGTYRETLQLLSPNAQGHLRIVGAAGVRFDGGEIVARAESVEVLGLVFERAVGVALQVEATNRIHVEDVAFVDLASPPDPPKGTLSHKGAARLTSEGRETTIALRNLSLVGYRGPRPPVVLAARGGTATVDRVLLAGSEQPPIWVGGALDVVVVDSVLALPSGVGSAMVTQVPASRVHLSRTTLLLDAPDAVVLPGHNPQHLPGEWLPAQVVDNTILARGPSREREPGVALERTEVRAAPAGDVDLDALRARARALAPVDRTEIEPLLGARP